MATPGLYEQWSQQQAQQQARQAQQAQQAYQENAYRAEAYAQGYQEAYTPGTAYRYGADGQAIPNLAWPPEADYGYAADDQGIASRAWTPGPEHGAGMTTHTAYRRRHADQAAPKDEDTNCMTSCQLLLFIAFLVLVAATASALVYYATKKESGGDESDLDLDLPTNEQPGSRTIPIYYTLPHATTTPHIPLPAQSPMPKSPLICIYGEATNESVEFPENGLCEFMFYEGLYGTGQPQLNVVNILASARPLNHFASEAAAPSSTQYGLSLHYGAQAKVAQDVESHEGRQNIAELWNRRIRHYGFLNIDFTRFDPQDFRDALATLRVLNNTLQRLRTKPMEAAYTGLGFYVVAGNRLSVSDAFTAVYTPSFIVAHGHIGFDDREYTGDCFVYPPTIMNGAKQYETSQLKALQMLEELNKKYAFAVSVSVAMFGRKYRAVQNGDLRIGTQCTYHPDDYLVPYEVLCTNAAFRTNVTEDSANKAIFSYDGAARWVVTFDNERTLRTKLCEGKSRNLALEYGVAVYGMEYSDYALRCPDLSTYGAYTRLLMVKKVRDFLTAKFTNSDDEERCKKITL